MKDGIVFSDMFKQCGKCRVRIKFSGCNCVVDTYQICCNHFSGTDCHVPNFTVTHLPCRKPYRLFTGIENGVWIRVPETVPKRRFGSCNSVVFSAFAIAPSVEDYENNRLHPAFAKASADKYDFPLKSALPNNSSSIRSSSLYFATRSVRE